MHLKKTKQNRLFKRVILLCVISLCIGTALGCGAMSFWRDKLRNDELQAEQEAKEAAEKKAEEERLARLVEKQSIPVLAYHSVQSDDVKEAYYMNNRYVISQSRFESQMAYLSANGYKALTLDEFYDWYTNGTKQEPKTVVITFDDGYSDMATRVEGILAKNHLIGTTFVIGSSVSEKRGDISADSLGFLTKDEIKAGKSMQYYSHTFNLHSFNEDGSNKVDTKTKDEIREDFKKEQEIVKTDYIALPHGHPSSKFDEIAKEFDTKLIFLFGNKMKRQATREDAPYQIPRISMDADMEIEDFTYYLGEKE